MSARYAHLHQSHLAEAMAVQIDALPSDTIQPRQAPQMEVSARELPETNLIFSTLQVFTPTTPAKFAFVERSALLGQLMNALRTPGKQVVVYGQSGSGKTTLLTNKLTEVYGSRVIVTRCTSATTFENLLLSAFDELNVYYAATTSTKKSSSAGSKLAGEYLGIKAALESKISAENATSFKRLLPPQLTPQRLAEFCGAADCCWLLEDFHKVPATEKSKLSQVMKVFMDTAAKYPAVKVVAIGAVDTARQVIEYDPDMRNRVAEIFVPLMTKDELKAIISKGEGLLRVNFGKHKKDIADYASGLGAVCHQLSLNICLAADIEATCQEETWITSSQFKQAIERYLDDASDTLKAVFDLATKQKKKGNFDNTRLIITAMSAVGENGAAHGDILAHVREKHADYPSGNLTTYLRDLQTSSRGEILRYDQTSGKFFFSDPLYFAYAQCMLVPPKEQKLLSIKLLGEHFKLSSNLSLWNEYEVTFRAPRRVNTRSKGDGGDDSAS